MKEEIFGPILPIVNVESVNEAVDFIKNKPKPLSLYIFSQKKDKIKQIINVSRISNIQIQLLTILYIDLYLSGKVDFWKFSTIFQETSSGSVCVNDVIIQLSVDTLPFGGVEDSGYGAYHGK